MSGQFFYPLSLETNSPGGGVLQAAYGSQYGRFAGPVRPYQRSDFTFFDSY
jgi:hypothetical protein